MRAAAPREAPRHRPSAQQRDPVESRQPAPPCIGHPALVTSPTISRERATCWRDPTARRKDRGRQCGRDFSPTPVGPPIVPYWGVSEDGGVTQISEPPASPVFTALMNFRDVGGVRTTDGGRIRMGRLYRSATPVPHR